MPKSLIEVYADFPSDESCLGFLEKMRWPNGVKCLACESDRISKFTVKETTRKRLNKRTGEVEIKTVPERHLYECLECGRQFTPTVGTIFNDSHLPLRQWFIAVALMCNAKKGLSAKQMQRDLGVTYRTAWYLNHRIRKAMVEGPQGMFTGTVEVDETYVGGKYDRRLKRAKGDKEPVVGMIERGGKVRTFHVEKVNRKTVVGKIDENISAKATLVVTDQSPIYHKLHKTRNHESVNHAIKEYVRGNIHTNTIENFWSLFKRGVIGSFHKVSIKHLHRYLSEFQYRFNNRDAENLFALVVIRLLIGSAMQYRELVANPADNSGAPDVEPF